jgi:transcriptional regulator with XRE-family HTH domain
MHWLKKARLLAELSQFELASRVGISQSLLSMMELGQREIEADEDQRLRRVMREAQRDQQQKHRNMVQRRKQPVIKRKIAA